MAEMMLCGTCIAPGRFELVPAPVPQTAPDGWVLVDIAAAGLCGTDYHIFAGRQPYLNYPRVIGHELSGRVAVSAAACAAHRGSVPKGRGGRWCRRCACWRRGRSRRR